MVTGASVTFCRRAFASPLTLSSGTITHITEACAEVHVAVGGREAIGHGSMYLSDLWAWPEPTLATAERDRILRTICQRIAADLADHVGGGPAHPLELGLHLHESCCERHATNLYGDLVPRGAEPTKLAVAMCVSPFDAAIHDAVGVALNRSAMDLYDDGAALPTADRWLAGSGALAIREMLGRPSDRRLPVWWIVGPGDVLPDALATPVGQWGVSRFKMKIMGRDARADAERTAAVYAAARQLGASDITISVDSNEANPDAESVADYLEALASKSREAFEALAYLEQPTGRDIQQHAFDWHTVGARKPVLLDEGLTSLGLLDEAKRQGWSGLAMKTCKGHSFVLVAAAWALGHDMVISLQDLTNPGRAAIHAALLAARLPTMNGVELNSRQFTPEANVDWLPQYGGLFEPRDGVHRLPAGRVVGLHVEAH
ncbi:MAG: hypothetical protein CMJ49_06690 [Planctomycetaceae bacterium]|nr:hypothetical protein [Planctomycetaceae bacterium]